MTATPPQSADSPIDRIYLDNAATTRPLPEVVQAMADVQERCFGNPSSAHGFGADARRLLEDAREFLRGSLGAASLVFTSGGTEADLLGVFGAAAARPRGRVLAAASDHVAVLGLTAVLRLRGHELVQVPVTEHGDLDPETLFDLLGPDVRVVSILHGHNELGTLARVEELASIVRHVSPDAHVHVDLVQAYGKLDFDLDLAGVDSVAVSGHKLHGPRGIGFLALSSKARVTPVMPGGGQEGGMRGGTENVAGAVGLARAAEHMLTHLDGHTAHMRSLADAMFTRIRDELGEAHRLGHPTRALPHVLSLRIPDVPGQALQQACAARGLAFSTGSACHEGDAATDAQNHVLAAIGLGRRRAREVVRLSFSSESTWDELDRAADILCDEADRLRALAPPSASPRRARRDGA
ncbi:MAG: cysteine desulfurase [Planctomycetes bacterium]|nr:cysteine desulfurase [Planctomycetota bacterium]